MTARKRRSKYGVHEQLAKQLVNTADGKWISSRLEESKDYAARAGAHKQRNLLNRERRKTRTARQWRQAYDEARVILRSQGDESEPLKDFVLEILQRRQQQRGKRNR